MKATEFQATSVRGQTHIFILVNCHTAQKNRTLPTDFISSVPSHKYSYVITAGSKQFALGLCFEIDDNNLDNTTANLNISVCLDSQV